MVDTETMTFVLSFIKIFMFIMVPLSIFIFVCQWKVFVKAGKPGWASFVPIYNYVVLFEIAKLPAWKLLLFFVQFVNIYIMIKLFVELAHRFGKSTGFGLGLLFLNVIFMAILAFDSSKYEDNVASNSNYQQPMNQPANQNMYQQPMNQPVNQNMYQQPMNQPANQNMYQQPMATNVVFCSNCGAQLTLDTRFCPKCGKER